MTTRVLVILLVSLLPCLVFAQPDDYERTVRTLDGETTNAPSGRIRQSGYNPEMGAGKFVVGLELLQVFTGRFGLNVGIATGEKTALHSTLAIGGFGGTFNGTGNVDGGRTLNIMPSYRLYFGERTLQGFYAGPFARYKRISANRFGNPSTDPWGQPNWDGDLIRDNYHVFAGGVLTGWQLLYKRFYFDSYFGLGMQTNTMTAQEESDIFRVFDQANRGVTYLIGLSIGFGLQKATED